MSFLFNSTVNRCLNWVFHINDIHIIVTLQLFFILILKALFVQFFKLKLKKHPPEKVLSDREIKKNYCSFEKEKRFKKDLIWIIYNSFLVKKYIKMSFRIIRDEMRSTIIVVMIKIAIHTKKLSIIFLYWNLFNIKWLKNF